MDERPPRSIGSPPILAAGEKGAYGDSHRF